MHAIQPSRPSRRPTEPGRIAPKPRPRRLPRPRHRAAVVETATKLTANVVLSIAFTSAIVNLLPYNLTQQSKLQEIRAEVEITKKRVVDLENQLGEHFSTDRQQIGEGGYRRPNEYPIHLENSSLGE